MANLRNHIEIHDLDTENANCTGSGPSYDVEYDASDEPDNAKVGHYVYVEKRGAGDGASSTVLSTYVYVITAVQAGGLEGGGLTLTMKYLYDTAGTGDDSPCDLPRGDGSSGSPNPANHKVVMILGPAFSMFM
tara:strand:+ start:857 stop:1255 length:399 start_codon:yes stop_codon:yes gene_type:complete